MPRHKSNLSIVAAAGLMVACCTFACASRAPGPDTISGVAGGNSSPSPLSIAQAPPSVSLEPLPNKEFLQKNSMLLIYPRADAEINAPSTFFVGATAPGSTLTLNGAPVRTNAQGFFAHVAPLKRGQNQFSLVRNGQTADAITLKVKRPAAPSAMAGPLKIDGTSVHPSEDIGVTAGDIVPFSVRAPAGSAVAVFVGTKKIPLASAAAGKVNVGLNTTFGVTYQAGVARDPNLYVGFYKVQPGDAFDHAAPKFVASKGGQSTQFVSKKTITVFAQPKILQTAHAETIVRLGPGAARTTPAPEGVRLLVDGYYGTQTRCELAPGKHVWIDREDLKEDAEPGRPPLSTVRTMNLESDPLSARIVIPLDQRLPFQIEQTLNPNRLTLKLYGATADTDWIGPAPPAGAPGAAGQNGAPGAGAEKPEGNLIPGSRQEESALIKNVVWRQTSDRVYQVVVDLKLKQQWGFWGDYEGTNLVLHVRKPPNVVPGSGSLKNLIVCVDPGHGGKETGAFGLTGVRESQINLAIGLKLKELLERAGATVIMTRTSDDITVSLPDRTNTAAAANANLLISVHNNSLPDGRDPWKERGTSTYYYQPQSLALARTLKDNVVGSTGFPDFGTRYQNLALCRPSKMLASLVEVGFMIHPDEYAQLLQPSLHEKAAAGIVNGVKKFLAAQLQTPAATSNSNQMDAQDTNDTEEQGQDR
ncbi:MAG: N-acetylmuramoyl-L-alanine amidase [Candidatus Obscuribacterales bacterium]